MLCFVSKTEKQEETAELALTRIFMRDKIFRYVIVPFFATDGNVDHHKETKNVFADRLGARTRMGFCALFAFVQEYGGIQ